MREWALLSVAVVALASSCVVPVEDVEETKTGGAAGAGSSGGSATGGNGGSGGAANGGTAGSGGSPDGGSAGSATGGSGGSAGTANGGSGGTGSAGAGGGGGTGAAPTCPIEGGAMVLVPDVAGGQTCVDATEVTQAAYQAFLGTNPNALTQIAECTGQSFVPSGGCNGFNPVTYPKRPSVCVDWCDARGFCQYVGKHLCGKVGGGPAKLDEANDPAANEWHNACSAGGTQKFPYGNLYDGSKCNGLNAGTIGPMDVTFFSACVGGYPGLHDMSGNVREWTDSCSGEACMVRGGSWLDTSSGTYGLGCDSTGTMGRTEVNDRLGFRCCAKPL